MSHDRTPYRTTRRTVALALIAIGAAIWAREARTDLSGHGGMVRAVAVSPDSSRVITASFDYTARLWDFAAQQELGALTAHNGPVNAAIFLPGGTRAVTGGDDGAIVLWDLETLRPIRRIEGHRGKVASLAVAPGGGFAASAGWDRSVRIWEISSGKEVARLDHNVGVNAVAFGKDETRVFVGDKDGDIWIWDTATAQPTVALRGHEMAVTDLASSSDGTKLLSTGIDGTIRLWDAERRTELQTMRGHDGPVFAVAYAPDGKSALSAGRDGWIIHWSLATGSPLQSIPAHDGPAWSVAFTHDERFALSAGSDETVRVWHLATGTRIGLPKEGDPEPKPWLDSTHPGAKLYRSCASCHSLDPNGTRRSGPHFANLFGRRAGSVSGYTYSQPLRKADFVWNEETLSALFQKGPEVFLPGTKMPLQRISREDDLRSLIDYMRIITAAPPDTKPSTDP